MDEHDRLRELSERIGACSPTATMPRPGRCSWTLLVVLGPHVAKEDFGLFPASLSGDGWDAVDRWEGERLGPSAVPAS